MCTVCSANTHLPADVCFTALPYCTGQHLKNISEATSSKRKTCQIILRAWITKPKAACQPAGVTQASSAGQGMRGCTGCNVQWQSECRTSTARLQELISLPEQNQWAQSHNVLPYLGRGKQRRKNKIRNHMTTKTAARPTMLHESSGRKGKCLTQSYSVRLHTITSMVYHFNSIHTEPAADRTFVFRCSELFKSRVYTTTDGHNPKIHHICAQIIFSLWLL